MMQAQNSRLGQMQRVAVPVLLGIIMAAGAVLRLVGVNWDQYQHLHPDERFLTMVETGIQMPGSIGEYFDTVSSPLNPYNKNFGTFVYGTYPLFITKFAGEALSPFGPLLTGGINRPADSDFSLGATLYRLFNDPGGYESIHIIGRILSAISDLLTVLLIFLIGRRLYGTRVGLLAAFFLAFSVLDIQQSHFFTVDTFANLPLVLAAWFTLDIAESRGGWRSFALAGAFFGLALAARINLATFGAIIVVACVLKIIKSLEDAKARAPSRALVESRTYGFAAETILPSTEARAPSVESSANGEQVVGERPEVEAVEVPGETRAITLGPLSLELQLVRRAAVATPGSLAFAEHIERREAVWFEPLKATLVGLVVLGILAFLVFRIAQPYAFQGLGINPKWLQDITSLKDLLSGEADYPPSHQWTSRPDYLFTWTNIVNWGMGLPLGLAAWAGLLVGAIELVRKRRWQHFLPFLWVGGSFFYSGQQFVKTMRYSLPIYPFLALFAAYFLLWLWNQARPGSRILEKIPGRRLKIVPAGIAAVVALVTIGYTLFWAGAFTTIYTREVSRVAASHWIVHNIPQGSVIANEQWDDPLPLRVEGLDPFSSLFKGVPTSSDGELQMYGEDTPEKRDQVITWLDATDYIVLSSNRLYLSIPRLPLRYPMTTKYYQWLFDGTLGFKPVKTFTSYPQLFGVVINDDNAEEAFSVYDHPKVLIFQKTPAYSHEKLTALLYGIDLSEVYRQKPIDYNISHGAYQLQPEDVAADYAGGTWSEIFNPDDWINRIPVVAWVAVLELLGLIAFPILFGVFRAFADRGYAFAKAFGILALGWGAWTLGSYHLVGFSRGSIIIALVAVGLVSVVATLLQWRALVAFLRTRLSLILAEEVIFLAFFIGFLFIRFGNPDLWHPYFGGEKPMDFAYLNAVIKTTWFPAYNPWFEGGYINYYYFGQLLSATLVRFTGIVPEVAYNLLLPMYFSLTALGAFGVAFNLFSSIGRRSDPTPTDAAPAQYGGTTRSFAAGFLAAVFVVILGNLGEAGVLAEGILKLGSPGQTSLPGIGGALALLGGLVSWLVDRQALPVPIGNWYWTATRVIPDTINEFPFFTFLYADLHAHLMGLAYTLVALAAGLHAVLVRGRLRWYDVGIIALVLGSLRAINTWDYPTYLALIGGAMVIGFFAGRATTENAAVDWPERLKRYLLFGIVAFVQIMLVVIPTNASGVKVTLDMIAYGLLLGFGLVLGLSLVGFGFDPRSLTRVLGWRFVSLIFLTVVFYFPFLQNYGSAYTSVELWKDQRTNLVDYLTVHGLFLFMVTSYLLVELLRRRAVSDPGQPMLKRMASPWLNEWVIYALPGLALFEFLLAVENLIVFAVILPLLLLAAWLLFRRDSGPEHRFISLLMVAALAMTLVVEVVTLKGDIGRMNTVFKFYLQGWVLFSISSAAGLSLIFDRLLPRRAPGSTAAAAAPTASALGMQLKRVWWAALGVLLFAGLLYPIFATWAKVNDRFVADSPAGLNGLDYMVAATYNVNNQDLALVQDYQAIQWLREHIKGSPVIAEASYELYRWNDRVSINTGLPTIVGWDWHTKQQYSLIDGGIIDQRKQDVAALYNGADPNAAMQLLRRYRVSYIYVGPLERALYDASGLSKFEAMTGSGMLSKVYDENGVQIYRLNPPVS